MPSTVTWASHCLIGAAENAGGSMLNMLFPILAIGVLFYFMLIRPEKRRRQETEQMQQSLKKNDHVVTIGGVYGVVVNPQKGPDRVTIRVDDETRTDLSFDYAFVIPALGANIELFVQPRVTNLFDEQAVNVVNASVWTSRNAGKGLTKFDPFTSKPQECTAYSADGLRCTGTGNWMKANTFGKPQSYLDYQAARTFTISFGVRF